MKKQKPQKKVPQNQEKLPNNSIPHQYPWLG